MTFDTYAFLEVGGVVICSVDGSETGNYYLRARYYTPGAGRFAQEDTHWNPGNMVYGDDPQKIKEVDFEGRPIWSDGPKNKNKR